MTTEDLGQSGHWRQQVLAASGCSVLGLLVAAAGSALPAPIATIGLGAALAGAALLLAWGADAAEVDFSGRLVLSVVVLMTVLPELVIEVHFAFSQQTSLVSANLTGATRLLLTGATGMPVLAAWLLSRRGQPADSFTLPPARRVDLGILFMAALYGVLIAVLGRVSLLDGFLLIGLYAFYLRRVRGTPDEPPAVVGVAASLAALPRQQRQRLLAGTFALAAITVVVVADPFTVALRQTGTAIGISPYLLVQSIVPLATETPEYVIAAVFALNHRPAHGVAILLGAAVGQWTLALGSLPFAYLAGGGPAALPLTGRDQVELALTVATTFMAVVALAPLRPERIDSWIVLTLFGIQFAFPTPGVRIAIAVVMATFALDVGLANHRSVWRVFGALRSRHPPPDPPVAPVSAPRR
jgi:cation:H+ antiporter